MYSGLDTFLVITGNPKPDNRGFRLAHPASKFQLSKVGFPIRRPMDQSLFAAPHGLSQRTTSFIASQRQGIHRIPLRHLIALIIDAHRSAAAVHCAYSDPKSLTTFREYAKIMASIERPFASNISENTAVKLCPQLAARLLGRLSPMNDRICFLLTMTDSARCAFAPREFDNQGLSEPNACRA